MKKVIFTAMLAVFVSMGAKAQLKFGVKTGWNFENFDIRDNIPGQLKKDNFTSWDLGVVAQLPLSGGLHLQPELLYSSQKIKLTGTGTTSGTSKISYFQVPVNLLYKVDLLLFNIFASGGVYFGYAVDRNSYASHNLQKTDGGVSLGVGAEVLRFQVNARYNWALKNISDIGGVKWKSNRFNLSIAYFIF